MVESKLVELVVAGSNPVGHPIFRKAKKKCRAVAQALERNSLQME
jgi:hypothetical protein